jgi:RNA polymerase sigma-70 factor (ECF subfamily)
MTPPDRNVLPREAITGLLQAHHQGDSAAFERLVPLVYEDLRKIARRQLSRSASSPTLNATALVHEAWFQLVDETRVDWQSRGHFFAIAARAMRRIVVDHARERSAQKRGGGQGFVDLDPDSIAVEQQAENLLALDQALTTIASFSERLARVAECRLFGGLSEEETAAALEISLRTAQREWQRARAWLQKEMAPAAPAGGSAGGR